MHADAARGDRRRRTARHARLRRRAHPLRRATALGSHRVAGQLARRHDAVHRQLRVHDRAGPARRCRVAAADAQSSRGHECRVAASGSRLDGRQLRRLPRQSRRSDRCQRRGATSATARFAGWSWATTASERPATPDEIAQMVALAREALDEGAYGFTSSQLELHVAHDGRGVPSNSRAPRRADRAVGDRRTPRTRRDRVHSPLVPHGLRRRRSCAGAGDGASGGRPPRPPQHAFPAASERTRRLEAQPRVRARVAPPTGSTVHPMFAANRQGAHFALGNTFLFDDLPSFRRTLVLPDHERRSALRDPRVRDEMRADIADPGRARVRVLLAAHSLRTGGRPESARFVGHTVSELARCSAKADELDAFLDVSLADDLEAQFALGRTRDPRHRAAKRRSSTTR